MSAVTGLTPAALTQAEVINPASATQLIFLSTSQTLTAGVCSAPVTVEALDTYGNVASATSTLTPTMGPAIFYSDACTTSAVSLTLANAQSQVFYFKDTLSGASTLSVSNNINALARQFYRVVIEN